MYIKFTILTEFTQFSSPRRQIYPLQPVQALLTCSSAIEMTVFHCPLHSTQSVTDDGAGR